MEPMADTGWAMADSTDVALHLSRLQWTSAAEAERRLAATTNCVLVAAAVLQGFVVVDGFGLGSLAAVAAIAGLGVWGLLVARRSRRRFESEMRRFEALVGRLDELNPDAGLVSFEMPSAGDGAARIGHLRYAHLAVLAAGIADAAVVAAAHCP